LREYALFLGLNYKKLAEEFEAEINVLEPKKQPEIFSKQRIKSRHLWAMPKIIKNILIFLIICVCFIYLGYRLSKIIAPPFLTVDSPAANLVTDQNSLLVSGRTEAEANLIINGQTVLTDIAGNFSQIINLKYGVNVITITANKKYSRSSTVTRQVLLKQ